MIVIFRVISVLAFSLSLSVLPGASFADSGHSSKKVGKHVEETLKSLREQHSKHEHGHDFEAMEKLSSKDLATVIDMMQDVGIVIPKMNAERGRKLFVESGCIVCHSVNEVGGDIGPTLNAADLPSPMNAFEFAARMWRGALSMTQMQEDLLGDVISLTGQELADLIAFAHDGEEQKKLTQAQIPEKFRKIIAQ